MKPGRAPGGKTQKVSVSFMTGSTGALNSQSFVLFVCVQELL